MTVAERPCEWAVPVLDIVAAALRNPLESMIETMPLTAPEKGHKQWKKGRVCRFLDKHGNQCTTPLSIHNGTTRCGAHGGWQPKVLRNLDLAHEREAFVEGLREVMEQP